MHRGQGGEANLLEPGPKIKPSYTPGKLGLKVLRKAGTLRNFFFSKDKQFKVETEFWLWNTQQSLANLIFEVHKIFVKQKSSVVSFVFHENF